MTTVLFAILFACLLPLLELSKINLEYIRARALADQEAAEGAEKLCPQFNKILEANQNLLRLQKMCALSPPAARAALALEGQVLAKMQDVELGGLEASFPALPFRFRYTRPIRAFSPNLCAIPGPYQWTSPVMLTAESELAGFAIQKDSERLGPATSRWVYQKTSLDGDSL